ncbi:hypothetical protein D1815_16090 [Aquimarina sp. AD1]|uniref:DUF6588 family protein n=1 Tax=Aquimarina sp. (strain AD1) TaxID=1714848 RepID=UPI000E4DCC69|nr:DUF6588 family protein [Aquimarina sp. AD1]AXT57190.1 hypothetical protein D1815_16090 [Aquimarina sp. AD1]RKN35823.1 hypothetical protein D7035_02735 [Aquimarina sp. AD1]
MKKLLLILFVFNFINVVAQENIDDLLAAGVNDAQRFATYYLEPVSGGLIYSMNQGWFNSAKSKRKFGFDISVILNTSFVGSDNKSFILDTSQYENLQFRDGSVEKEVATAFGDIEGVIVVVEGESSIPGLPPQDAEFELPTGLGESNINFVPTAFLQASFSPLKGTEIKARFFPQIKTSDAKVGFYGIGLQHEFTSWLPADKLFPVAIAGLIAYTHLDGSYDFTNTNIVDGENQQFENNTNTLLFQLIGSTKLPVFNVYGGIGYISGTSTTDLKGTYRVRSGIVSEEEITNPFSVENKVSGVRGTLGAKVSVGFFKANLEYSLSEYSGVSLGLNFGF